MWPKYFLNVTYVPFVFFSQSESPEDPINSWVEDKTSGEITDFLEDGTITEDTIMMLVNAVYFKGKWMDEFDEDDTDYADFKGLLKLTSS